MPNKEELDAMSHEQLRYLVNEAKLREAIAINNDGRDEQIQFLLEHYGVLPLPTGEVRLLTLILPITREEADKKLLQATIEMTGHNMTLAAAHLGVNRRTIYRQAEKYKVGPYRHEIGEAKAG